MMLCSALEVERLQHYSLRSRTNSFLSLYRYDETIAFQPLMRLFFEWRPAFDQGLRIMMYLDLDGD